MHKTAKSAGSRILAALCLVYVAPIMLVAALIIWCASGRPVLLKRIRRIGTGRAVAGWEFRTGVDNDMQKTLSTRATPRTTWDAFIYDSWLSMLPWLFNVLRGDLTFGAMLELGKLQSGKTPDAAAGTEAKGADASAQALLIWSMMDRLELDPPRLDRYGFERKVAIMTRRCAGCENVAACRNWCEAPEPFEAYREFCPNASMMDSLPRDLVS